MRLRLDILTAEKSEIFNKWFKNNIDNQIGPYLLEMHTIIINEQRRKDLQNIN